MSNQIPTAMFDQIGNTPMREISLLISGAWRSVNLKLESCNPAGSSKDRTAQGLLDDLENRGLIGPRSTIIESTSGNLGVSLAHLCRSRGYRFLAVIDPKTTSENQSRMRVLGASLEMVSEQDETGGYLLSRLKRVRELCAESSNYVWTDQYSNPANPAAHCRTTAPEIFTQTGGKVDAVFVAVSTGGTLVGIERYFREVSPKTTLVAVDAIGSVIFGSPSGKRKLTGIGSSLPSAFILPGQRFANVQVADRDAFAVCNRLAKEINLRVGGSSGAVIFACAQALAENSEWENIVGVCADGGSNYDSTIYSAEWLEANDFDPDYCAPFIEAVKDSHDIGPDKI
jgi:2,3-diaminopropionate biosynthesis protein SbnA